MVRRESILDFVEDSYISSKSLASMLDRKRELLAKLLDKEHPQLDEIEEYERNLESEFASFLGPRKKKWFPKDIFSIFGDLFRLEFRELVRFKDQSMRKWFDYSEFTKKLKEFGDVSLSLIGNRLYVLSKSLPDELQEFLDIERPIIFDNKGNGVPIFPLVLQVVDSVKNVDTSDFYNLLDSVVQNRAVPSSSSIRVFYDRDNLRFLAYSTSGFSTIFVDVTLSGSSNSIKSYHILKTIKGYDSSSIHVRQFFFNFEPPELKAPNMSKVVSLRHDVPKPSVVLDAFFSVFSDRRFVLDNMYNLVKSNPKLLDNLSSKARSYVYVDYITRKKTGMSLFELISELYRKHSANKDWMYQISHDIVKMFNLMPETRLNSDNLSVSKHTFSRAIDFIGYSVLSRALDVYYICEKYKHKLNEIVERVELGDFSEKDAITEIHNLLGYNAVSVMKARGDHRLAHILIGQEHYTAHKEEVDDAIKKSSNTDDLRKRLRSSLGLSVDTINWIILYLRTMGIVDNF